MIDREFADGDITDHDMEVIAAPLRQYSNPKALGMLGVMAASYLATTKSVASRGIVMEEFIRTLRATVNNMELQE